jgi:hypothetical protein
MEEIENVRSYNGIVSDEPTMNESTLVRANHIRDNMFNSIG